MRKVVVYTSVFITLMLLALTALRCHPYYCYATRVDASFIDSVHSDDTVRISIIGDSWAAYHGDFNDSLQSLFSQDSIHALIASKGNIGAKSREIYERFSSTTKSVLVPSPDYCVVFAGINDAVAKMGKSFYVYHYMQILHYLLDSNIKPVVIEIPDVNYRAISEREPLVMRIRHWASSLLMESEFYSFNEYRTALKSAISESNLTDSVVYIHAAQWNPSGYKDSRNLYQKDETHLNARGYHLLDSCIASEVVRDIQKTKLYRYE